MEQIHNPANDASVARDFKNEGDPRTQTAVIARATTLDELEAQFAAIGSRAQALVDSAGAELCNKRPAAESWSAAECLQHLNITSDAYFPIWQQIIANAGPRKAEMNAPYRADFWGRLLPWILEPPARTRSKTPVPFEPAPSESIESVLPGFLERQERIVAALHRCRGRAIDRVKMASPIDRRIRYSIWSSFLIVAAHQRRHLSQAERAVRRYAAWK